MAVISLQLFSAKEKNLVLFSKSPDLNDTKVRFLSDKLLDQHFSCGHGATQTLLRPSRIPRVGGAKAGVRDWKSEV